MAPRSASTRSPTPYASFTAGALWFFSATLIASAVGCTAGGTRPSPRADDAGPLGTGDAATGMPGSDAGSPPNVGGEPGPTCASVERTAANRRTPADIMFVVDNSNSMADEVEAVRENLNAFSRRIIGSGIDVRVIMISSHRKENPEGIIRDILGRYNNGVCVDAPLGSGACPNDESLPGYVHPDVWVGSTDGLNIFLDEFPSLASHLRPEATKTVVFVTDDDAAGRDEDGDPDPSLITSADEFMSRLSALDADFAMRMSFSGIYSFTDCAAAASPGTVYAELVERTGGVAGDLCLQDFEPVFRRLATGVIERAELDCAWTIPEPPPDQIFRRDRVNVRFTEGSGESTDFGYVEDPSRCGSEGGWYYDNPDAPTEVRVCPSNCDEIRVDPAARIDILFGCQTQLI